MSQNTQENIGTVVLRKVILSYPHLAEPSIAKGSTKPNYSAQIRIKKTDEANIKAIRKAIKEAFEHHYKDDKKKWPKLYKEEDFDIDTYLCSTGQRGFPLRKPDVDDEEMAGMVFLSAKNKKQPLLFKKIETGRLPLKNPELIEEELYPGSICDVIVNFYGFDHEASGAKGVFVSLRAVIKMEEGEHLGGGGYAVDLSEYGDEVVGDDDLDI